MSSYQDEELEEEGNGEEDNEEGSEEPEDEKGEADAESKTKATPVQGVAGTRATASGIKRELHGGAVASTSSAAAGAVVAAPPFVAMKRQRSEAELKCGRCTATPEGFENI